MTRLALVASGFVNWFIKSSLRLDVGQGLKRRHGLLLVHQKRWFLVLHDILSLEP
jgi:hypothetical protein